MQTYFDALVKTNKYAIAQSKAKVQAIDNTLTDVITSTPSLLSEKL